MPTVSIILPVYNVGQYLERCLNSILAQTCNDWQAIIVNDGSTDNSLEIAERFASEDSRFTIINKENGGLSDARNVGMAHAKGEYIMFVDTDDFIHPQTCEIALALAQKTGCDIVSWKKDTGYTNFTRLLRALFNPAESTLVNMMPLNYRKRYDIGRLKYYYTDNLLKHVSANPTRKKRPLVKGAYIVRFLFKKELIQDIPFIKGLKYEDFPWWYEVVLNAGPATITYLPLYYYFRNRTSITKSIKRAEWFVHWCKGLEHIYLKYKASATEEQMMLWSKNVKWFTLKKIARKLRKVGADDREEVAAALGQLASTGIMNDAGQMHGEKAKRKIMDFIGTQHDF